MVKLSKSHSFFLFGARGVGKSYLISDVFKKEPDILFIDLLKSDWEEFLINPDNLISKIESLKTKPKWVIIDEVQKIPKLLDIVHYLIEKEKIKFALTGSSARKLKRGAANLLAGRAFFFELYPYTHIELGSQFNLQDYLSYGGLPEIYNLKSISDKENFLRTYTLTYLKEEIQAEQIVRNLKPFRMFLEVAAQSNAKIVNYSKIGQDIHVDTKTVQSYFEILQDTHVGVLLPSYHRSLRKRQKTNPKFYYFDTGVTRSLSRRINVPLTGGNFEFGDLFEQFVILEMRKLNSYKSLDFQFSYLQTNNNLEVDVVIERPGRPTAFVEIKSGVQYSESDFKSLISLKKDYPKYEYFLLSQSENEQVLDGINCFHWKKGLVELGF